MIALVVLVPWGRNHYAFGSAQAVLERAPPGALVVFACGWWPPRDGKEV